jgi:hypothetical protein
MTKTEVILTILERGAEITVDLFRLFGAIRYRDIDCRMKHLMYERHSQRFKWVESLEETQKFYSMLSYLKRQGFVSKQKTKGSTSWKITGDGLRKVRKLRQEASCSARLSQFGNISGESTKIVTFDVPERNRKKRAWLRSALSSMGFSLLHKSVWMGKKEMPREFFFELHRKKLLRYVHIFAVTKSGTLSAVSPNE